MRLFYFPSTPVNWLYPTPLVYICQAPLYLYVILQRMREILYRFYMALAGAGFAYLFIVVPFLLVFAILCKLKLLDCRPTHHPEPVEPKKKHKDFTYMKEERG